MGTEMREELAPIRNAIESKELPLSFEALFAESWNAEAARFSIQETFVIDFKDRIPNRFSDGYGAGIVRLAIAFYNTFGGIIVFGVNDATFELVGAEGEFDIEKLNRILSDIANVHAEALIRSYRIDTAAGPKTAVVLLIPRRDNSRPAKLITDFGPYPAGSLWIRDRHEVLTASQRHLPLLYSERVSTPDEHSKGSLFPVHRSLPPSPATLKDFVNRGNLLERLWDWFVFGDQPRLYLHGPGGSGKSTLAYEFARSLAENGHAVTGANGDHLDYVLYISGKESEFNPQVGKQQAFALRDFSSSQEQFTQILYHSGFLGKDDLESVETERINVLLTELFDVFSGLIVIDDIDALSRRQVDTGEEGLFIRGVKASKRTRILYTLRNNPAYAVNSALGVPGLNTTELVDFIESCCGQFSVPHPSADLLPKLEGATNSLPLLVETVILLRRNTSNYQEAIRTFLQRGGDDARRYLYQREYDRLESQGKSRILLAALQLVGQPIGFSTLLGLLQFPREQLAEAISESNSIFLSTQENEIGETLYELAAPCVPFIELVSKNIAHFGALKHRVEHFKSVGKTSSPREAALIVNLERCLREKNAGQAIHLVDDVKPGDPIMENPKIRALMGQAYAELGPDYREQARECFRHAEGVGYSDVFMMRRWFYMEFSSGYGLLEAERICRSVIEDKRFGPRYKSEFWSKLGSCLFQRALSLLGANRERGLELLRQSIASYLEAIFIGQSTRVLDGAEPLTWMEKPLQRFVFAVGPDVEHFFLLLEELADRKHDVSLEGIDLVLGYLTRSRAPADRSSRQKLKNLCDRTMRKISRSVRPLSSNPGFERVVISLEAVVEMLDGTTSLTRAQPSS